MTWLMDKFHDYMDQLWVDHMMTPEEKIERVKTRLQKPLADLGRQISRLDTDLEFLQKDIEAAARAQNRQRLTTVVRDSVRQKRKRRRLERNRTTLEAFVGAVDDIQISEKMHSSMDELLQCTATLDMDLESVRATTSRFQELRMSLGTSAEMIRDAVEASDDEESLEDDEVTRIVEEALQQSSMALLDALPVLGNSRPPAPQQQRKKELSLDEMDRQIGGGKK